VQTETAQSAPRKSFATEETVNFAVFEIGMHGLAGGERFAENVVQAMPGSLTRKA
jgi:hypothetical protein